jgi:hypothetical protein
MSSKFLLPGQGTHEEPEWVVWLTVVVALVIGYLLATAVAGQTVVAAAGGTDVAYPASWSKYNESGAVLAAADLNNQGIYAPRVIVRQVAKTDLTRKADATLNDALKAWTFNQANALVGYHLLNQSSTQVQGRPAVQVEYAYLLDSPKGAGGGTMPGLMRAVDTIVASGDQYYILTFAAESSKFTSLRDLRDELLESWRIP